MAERRYLNKHEREDVVVLAAFAAFLENRIKHWARLKRSKEKLKYARSSFTFANKVLQHILQPLETSEKNRVLELIKTYSVGAFIGVKAQREYERMKQIEENMVVHYDDFYDLADHALIVCKSCTFTGDKVEECNMRKIFIRYDIPVFDQYAPSGICPYRQVQP